MNFKRLICLVLNFSLLLCCTKFANGPFLSINEQVDFAGAVVEGTIVQADGVPGRFNVELADVVFYKGSGPSQIRVSGFTGGISNLCAPSVPSMNTRAYLFLCRRRGEWWLNVIGYKAGMELSNQQNDFQFDRATSNFLRSENSSTITYYSCHDPSF